MLYDEDIIEHYINENIDEVTEIVTSHEDFDMLAAVEDYAEYHGEISSESMLSERFDSYIHDVMTYEELQNFINDGPMFRETFNNWTDSLCKGGELHDLQYHEYGYVGQYEDK